MAGGACVPCRYEVCEGFFNNVLGWTEWWVTMPKIFVDQVRLL